MNEKAPPELLDDALRQLHAEVLAEPVPERFMPAVDQLVAAHAQRTQRQRLWHTAGMAASLALTFGLGWLAHANLGAGAAPSAANGSARFAQAAAVAHVVYSPEVRHPVEVAAEQQEHLVQWLSKRLGKPLKVPDLQTEGYALLGGRLLPGDSGTRAQFMYQNAAGERLTLYIGAVNGDTPKETAFRFHEEQGTSSFYWIDQGFGYALSGPLPKERLLGLSNLVYRQL
jgi:anti-sigma factor RsiW